ncbi:hypothetical protein B7494_g3090 [Chlorociboria aeruginascens]|nr:hypothetical protein B7494_g3090 [Chlorociboria aeruginascens]
MRLKLQMMGEEKFAQEVAHILSRANAMKAQSVADYYEVSRSPLSFLVVLIGLPGAPRHCPQYGVRLIKYRTNIFTGYKLDYQSLRKHTPVVHRYGPVDICDAAQRAEAMSKIYKLMLDRATTIRNRS